MDISASNKFLNYDQLINYDEKIKQWVYDYVDDSITTDIAPMIPDVDSTLNTSSSNAIANKAVATALNNKASTSVATTTANGLMSSSDKTKLNGIATGANKTAVDTYLSSSSTNPVRNSVITSALNNKQTKVVAGNNIIATGLGLWCSTATSTTMGQMSLGVLQLNSTTSYKTLINLTQYQALIQIDNTYILLTPAQIKFCINGTVGSLNIAKAKELGILT